MSDGQDPFPCFLSLWISASGSCDTATACIHVCCRSVGWKWRVVALGSSPPSRERQHTCKLLSTSIALYLQFLNQRTKRSLYTCQNDTNQWMKIADEECKIGLLSLCSHFTMFVGMHNTLVLYQLSVEIKKITLHVGYLITHADLILFRYRTWLLRHQNVLILTLYDSCKICLKRLKKAYPK